MKEKLIPSSWLEKEGRRLDCGPYLSGAIEAKLLLDKLSASKESLIQLTAGHDGGIYNGPQFVRNYVSDPTFGVGFISSSSMVLADLSKIDLLKRKDAQSPRLKYLRLSTGMILISCSGTIGRMAYARPEMDGLWSSQDVLKVVADANKILPGYLYSFLASKFGLPLVIGGTYGAIIQHIEPHHIYDLPVPRLGNAFEADIHKCVHNAAEKRSQARAKLVSANNAFYQTLKLTPSERLGKSLEFSSFKVKSSSLSRLDAHFFSPACVQASQELSTCYETTKRLDEIARVFTPGIFKRIHVSDPRYGYPYFSGSELFELVPEPRGLLSRRSANIEDYIVKREWLLIQDAGQLGGLIGQITRVRPGADGSVVSNHLMRVVCHDSSDTPYVFLVLNSSHGHLAILRHAFGTSIPQLDPAQVRTGVSIPWLDPSDRATLGVEVKEAWKLTDEADALEADAIKKVEAAIAEGV